MNFCSVPETVRRIYGVDDVDVAIFLDNFKEPEGGKILEVGAHDHPVANMLSRCGFKVTGIDLREYDRSLGVLNYEYIRGDFCDPPREFLTDSIGTFDAVVALSCIEHFGLGTYQEGPENLYYDVLAINMIWHLLKEGGTLYLTVPIGGKFTTVLPDWRVYDFASLKSRLIQDFTVEKMITVAAGPFQTIDHDYKGLEGVPAEVVSNYFNYEVPHITCFLKMMKISKFRLAPNRR